uniref:DNA-directed RNA polymerase III subunit RPC5 n=1 Tax=Setaria italica TaxID=4555 RepID=K3YLJ5_SETIT
MATGGDKPPSLDADVDMADLASLDAPAASSAAAAGVPSTRFRPKAKGKPKPKPEAPKPVPVAVPKPEPEPEPMPDPASAAEPEPEAANAAPPEDDRVDAMEVDGAGDAAGVGERAEAEEEEEDFVVREIDVYYTPKPFDDDTKLYIMQYPLRPCWRPYELNEICEEVRVKPLSSEIEVDLSVDTQSENYDQEAPLRLTKQVSLLIL